MKSQHSVQTISRLITLILIVGACVLVVRMLQARQAPPSFEGRLLLYSTGNIFEIPSGSTAEKAADLRIAGPGIDPRYIAPWPEKNYLTYTTYKDVHLLDLATGEVKTFSTGPTDCVTWSPDLASISYLSTKFDVRELYLYDVASGISTLVYAAPSATYEDGRTHYGAVTCGAWIGADRFVFNRTVGMPGQLRSINGVTEEVSTNTTTLAIIADSLTLVDSPRQLHIRAISDDGKHILFQQGLQGISALYHAALPPSLNNFESLRPRLIVSEYSGNRVPIINNEIFYRVYQDGERQIRFINLETLEERLGPKIPGYINSWTWVGDPKNNLIAYQDDTGAVWVLDLETEGSISIVDDALLKDMENLGLLGLSEGVPHTAPHIIGWLPSK